MPTTDIDIFFRDKNFQENQRATREFTMVSKAMFWNVENTETRKNENSKPPTILPTDSNTYTSLTPYETLGKLAECRKEAVVNSIPKVQQLGHSTRNEK